MGQFSFSFVMLVLLLLLLLRQQPRTISAGFTAAVAADDDAGRAKLADV